MGTVLGVPEPSPIVSLYILKSIIVLFAGTDLDYTAYRIYKNLTVTDLTGVKGLLCGFDDAVNRDTAYDYLQFDLR